MPRIAFTSVGCKLNRYEIQVMAESLRPYGFTTVPFHHEADCYVVNTCTVTGDADISSRQLIRRARRQNPNSKVIVTGCYAHLQPQEIGTLGVDYVVSNKDKEKLPAIILGIFGLAGEMGGRTAPAIDEEMLISGMDGMTRAFVKIQEGCDDKCTFCTIWMARGTVRSRSPKAIIHEINKLAANGFKEVALTGVHIGKYAYYEHKLTDLLQAILEQTSIERVRLSSLNPQEISEGLIELMASNSRICPHAHLSVQSGDDQILQEMGRHYNSQIIESAIGRLVRVIPNITIGADIIVGFPGEESENFENTRKLIASNPIHHLHVFPYSDRPGTLAAQMKRKIAPNEKAARAETLRQLGREKKRRHLNSFIGKPLNVLFENREYRNAPYMTGLSENYLRIKTPLMERLKGQIITITPEKTAGEILVSNSIIANNN